MNLSWYRTMLLLKNIRKLSVFAEKLKRKEKRKQKSIVSLHRNFERKTSRESEIKRVDLRSNSYAPRRRIIMFDNITVYTDNLLSHTRLDLTLSY